MSEIGRASGLQLRDVNSKGSQKSLRLQAFSKQLTKKRGDIKTLTKHEMQHAIAEELADQKLINAACSPIFGKANADRAANRVFKLELMTATEPQTSMPIMES